MASCSTCSNRARNLPAAARAASSASTSVCRATLATRDHHVSQLVGDLLLIAHGDRLPQLAQLLVDLGEWPDDVRPVEADLGCLARQVLAVGERRQRARNSVEHRRALLLDPLDVVPVGLHGLGVVGGDVAEDVRVPAHQLVVHRLGDVGDREAPFLLGDGGVELDLVQHVAELLDERRLRCRVVRIECADRVDELEGLLDEVRHQGVVGLLDVPRAALAQRAGQFVEAEVAGGDRHADARHVDTGQVVGVDGSIELAPRRVGDELVARARGAAG